jgi:hypothetical protein
MDILMIPLVVIDDALFNVITAIIGSIFLLLIGVLGYFLKKLGDRIEQFGAIVNSLQLMFNTDKEVNKAYWKSCEVTHGIINSKFDNISTTLDKHGEKLAEHDLSIQVLKFNRHE